MAFVVTAVATAVEVGTFATIATAVSEVGIAMSVVGAVTGSKELTKWGGYLGLAGGVGSLASSAIGTASEGALDLAGQDIATTAYSDADPVLNFSDSASGLSGVGGTTEPGSTFGLGNASLGGTLPTDAIAGYDGPSAPTVADPGMLGASPADVPTGGTELQPNTADSSETSGATNPGQAADGTQGNRSFGDSRYGSQTGIDAQYTGTGSAAPPTDTSSNGIAQWFKSQPKNVQDAILQGAAGAAKGLFSGWSEEQRNALDREKFNLDKQKYNTAVTNASAQPSIKFAPVGIINSQLKA